MVRVTWVLSVGLVTALFLQNAEVCRRNLIDYISINVLLCRFKTHCAIWTLIRQSLPASIAVIAGLSLAAYYATKRIVSAMGSKFIEVGLLLQVWIVGSWRRRA